ncbi:MAG: ArsR family transcriptional regulator [Myxococcales bacterium]|nr:MAG: ArsR family transcriptional regulator [Myxococcales bacterium]
MSQSDDQIASAWSFISNHGHVLVCIGRNSNVRVRDIAQAVGITERAVLRILGEREEVGVIARIREGRRTRYEIDERLPLRHPIEAQHSVGELLQLLGS